MEKYYFLFAILTIISVWDARTFRIPNAFIALSIPASFVVVGCLEGWEGLLQAVISFVVSSVLLYGIWAVFHIAHVPVIGAGDYKLLMVISIFLGIADTFIVFYYSIMFAAVIFLLILPPSTVSKMFTDLFYYLFYAIPVSKPKKVTKFPNSIPISLGVIGILYFHDILKLFLRV